MYENELNLASKRSNNILDTTKLETWCKENNIILSNINDVIDKCFTNYNQN